MLLFQVWPLPFCAASVQASEEKGVTSACRSKLAKPSPTCRGSTPMNSIN